VTVYTCIAKMYHWQNINKNSISLFHKVI